MSVAEEVNAKKKPIDRAGAAALLGGAKRILVAKGKKVLAFDMKQSSMDEVLEVALGPTGNLRAPAFRKGDTWVIGFEEGVYREVLG